MNAVYFLMYAYASIHDGNTVKHNQIWGADPYKTAAECQEVAAVFNKMRTPAGAKADDGGLMVSSLFYCEKKL